MARKLSRIARHGGCLFALLAGAALGRPAHAQQGEGLRITEPTAVVENPFTDRAPASSAVPDEPLTPRREPTIYRNPFATMSLSPPTAPPARPGPISRWQRAEVLTRDVSSVKTAILSTSAARLLGSSAEPCDAPAGIHLAPPPDPIQFAPRPLEQPAWLVADLSAAHPLPAGDGPALPAPITADIFRLPRAATPARAELPADDPPTRRDDLLGDDADPPAAPVDPDWLPIIVSDHVDSPENCYEQARQAADTAGTVDQFSTITEFCHRGLGGGPPPDLALALRRLAAWAYNRRGEMRSEAREQHDALADFQTAIRLDPNCFSAIHNRGVTLAEEGQSAAALRDFNRALELNPGFAIGYRNRAELLASLGRMSEAVADYTRAIDQISDDPALFRARGYAWQRLGEYDRALDDLNTSLGLQPDQPDAYTQRGNLSAELGEFDRALANYQEALRIDPNWGEAHRSLAWLWATCPDPRYRDARRAVDAAEQATQLLPENDSFALDALAAALANAGQFDEAVRVQEQAIATAPPDAIEPMRQRLALYRQRQPYRGEHPSAVQPASHTTPE